MYTFHDRFLSLVWGYFDALCKISDLKTFKRIYPAFSSNFSQALWKVWQSGMNTAHYVFWSSAKVKILWHFEILVITQGLKNSKYYSYSFHLITTKFHRDIAYHRRIQAITFLSNQPCVQTFCGNFNIRVNGRVLKYTINMYIYLENS